MSKKKKVKIIAIWIMALMLLGSITVHAAYNYISVTLVRQAKSNWCWAACLEMSATSLGYTLYDQWDIVKEVKGTVSDSYPNETGGTMDYLEGMEFATYDNYTATRVSGTISMSSMDTYISRGIPVIIALGTYSSSGTRISGHAVVVFGVDEANNRFQVRDPGSDSVVTYNYATITNTSQSRYWDKTVKITSTRHMR